MAAPKTKTKAQVKKERWFQPFLNIWRKCWRFERLMLVIGTPVLILAIWQLHAVFTSHWNLLVTAVKLADEFRTVRTAAQDNNTTAVIRTQLPDPDGCGSYAVTYGKGTVESYQVILPKDVSLSGSVVFDAHGAPDAASAFYLRHGLDVIKIVVDAHGFVSAT